MNINGWLIYNKLDVAKNQTFINRIITNGKNNNLQIDLYIKENFNYGICDNKLSIKYNGVMVPTSDFVINRSRDSLLSKHLEYMGVKVYNSSFVSGICNDKARTHQFLARDEIRMMDTMFCKRSEILNGISNLKFPLIIKDPSGRGGKEVYKAKTNDELARIVADIGTSDLILQEICSNPGKDLRVFVVGKEIIAAIIRYSEKDFRANYSLGGSSKLYILNSKERSLINKIISKFDFGMVGIDFLLDEAGELIFNEIEDVVGSRTLSINSDIDITEIYINLIAKDFGC